MLGTILKKFRPRLQELASIQLGNLDSIHPNSGGAQPNFFEVSMGITLQGKNSGW